MKTAKAAAKDVHALEKIFEKAGLEGGLIEAMSETLKKDPSARGTFDGLVSKGVQDQTDKYLAKTTAALNTAEQDKAALVDAKTSTEGVLARADETLTASNLKFSAAHDALKQGKDALKAADAAVTNFEKDIASAGKSLEDAKAQLQSFNDGALASFVQLQSLGPRPEPEPEVPVAAEEPAVASA